MNDIELNNVTVEYDNGSWKQTVFKDMNTTFTGGEISVVFGSSGSGKSTLLHLISGIGKLDSGQVLVGGLNPYLNRQSGEAVRKQLGFVFQSPLLIERTSVFEYCVSLGRLAGNRKEVCEQIVDEVLEGIEIGDLRKERVHNLSAGERHRVSLVASLARNPQYLILDEPTGSLDVRSSRVVFKFLKDWQVSKGTTVVLASHDPEAKTIGKCFEIDDYNVRLCSK